MRTRIVRIGNSRGIRIPKALLLESGLEDEVELSVDGDQLILSPVREPRAGWAEAFRRMAEVGDDLLLDGEALGPTSFDDEEWEWE